MHLTKFDLYTQTLAQGGVGVLPTDTIYGVVAVATNQAVVERIFAVKKRTPTKPLIILISHVDQLGLFGVSLSSEQSEVLGQVWPGPTSVALACDSVEFTYLHRGTNSLAFRLPAHDGLQKLIAEVGPLAAPSANPEGLPSAKTIDEAKKYFGDSVDVYVDGGELRDKASTLIRLSSDGSTHVLRA